MAKKDEPRFRWWHAAGLLIGAMNATDEGKSLVWRIFGGVLIVYTCYAMIEAAVVALKKRRARKPAPVRTSVVLTPQDKGKWQVVTGAGGVHRLEVRAAGATYSADFAEDEMAALHAVTNEAQYLLAAGHEADLNTLFAAKLGREPLARDAAA